MPDTALNGLHPLAHLLLTKTGESFRRSLPICLGTDLGRIVKMKNLLILISKRGQARKLRERF